MKVKMSMSWSTGVIELFALYTCKSPVILPRESHGQRSLAGYSSKGPAESDTIEMIYHARTIVQPNIARSLFFD